MVWLRQLSWPEFRHHPWRHLAALLAVTLGVALAFSVELINRSALDEFSAAVRAIDGDPDFELRGSGAGFDETLYARVAADPRVALASPVIEIDTAGIDPQGKRVALKLLGIDALVAARLAPALLPRLEPGAPRFAMLDPGAVFLNPQARQRLVGHSHSGVGGRTDRGDSDNAPASEAMSVRLQAPDGPVTLRVRGSVAVGGPALAVMDIAGAQTRFGWLGRLSRIGVRLAPGADRAALLRDLALPPGVRAAAPEEAAQRVSALSRAYRVNLTVLALVALFTGAFLVFSILALSVAQRQPQLALLGVLGLGARARLALVLLESVVLGAVGSVLGLLLGTALAALALRLLAGDLGGGYFPGVAPSLQFDAMAALLYGLLGVAAALVGGWLPARAAQRIAPAQALKGLGSHAASAAPGWLGPLLLALSVPLALLPPVMLIPLAAYLSVACLLLGGIACVPAGVALLLARVRPARNALAQLAIERARVDRHTATIAVAGVIASLSLAVALTVMVGSFRDSVSQWLEVLLPADLYVRVVGGSGSDTVALPPALLARAAALPGVLRVEGQRTAELQLDPTRPTVALIARPLPDPAQALPLVGEPIALPAGATAAYVSEAVASLYGATPGTTLNLPLPSGASARVFVRAVWRDYARQFGAVVLALPDYQRLSGDMHLDSLALWLRAGTDPAALQQGLREFATATGFDATRLEFASPGEIRAASLRLFDRSFAVTYWLQAVAIGIGLFGIAASFSAQVLARRKEFGLLAHLGLTRRQVLAVVATEGVAWSAVGALLGLLLGLAVSVVLVKVVNPQSFHWTMELAVPWARLALLCAAVLAAGTLTAWLAARGAAGRNMALAVKEDW
ncbi:MAG: ABC transporter permease [Burkholderiaceae bacterium]